MSATDYEITVRGPLFDGTTSAKIKQYTKAVVSELSKHARDHVLAGTAVYKEPTGYYKSHITVKTRAGVDLVTDQGVVYGPWLEKGPRGGPASTGYAGYHLWEKAFRDTKSKVQEIGDSLIGKYLK